MKTYEVEVKVTITKYITVEAQSEHEAIDEVFAAGIDLQCNPNEPERYEEEVLSVIEVKRKKHDDKNIRTHRASP